MKEMRNKIIKCVECFNQKVIDIFGVFFKTIFECVISVLSTVKHEADKLYTLLELYVIYNLVIYGNTMRTEKLVLACILTVLCLGFLKKFILNLQNKTIDGMPVPRQRLTRKTAVGTIEFTDDADYLQMMQYVCELEEYFQKRGWI